jgi:hypothetical protein
MTEAAERVVAASGLARRFSSPKCALHLREKFDETSGVVLTQGLPEIIKITIKSIRNVVFLRSNDIDNK